MESNPRSLSRSCSEIAFILLVPLCLLAAICFAPYIQKDPKQLNQEVLTQLLPLCFAQDTDVEIENSGTPITVKWVPKEGILEVSRGGELAIETSAIEELRMIRLNFGDVLLYLEFKDCPIS